MLIKKTIAMKTVLRVLLFVPLILFLGSCSKELQQAAEDSVNPRTRAGMPEGAFYLILGQSPTPPAAPDWNDMQLCLNRPLSRNLYIQLSVRTKNGPVIGAELAGSDYYIPANQRYVNISLPRGAGQVVATIKYLTYDGPEALWYSTMKYQLTYEIYAPYVTYQVISEGAFVDFRNPTSPVTPTPDPGEIKPIDPPALPEL